MSHILFTLPVKCPWDWWSCSLPSSLPCEVWGFGGSATVSEDFCHNHKVSNLINIIWFPFYMFQVFLPTNDKGQFGVSQRSWVGWRLWAVVSVWREFSACVTRGSGRKWEMVMKELIASSGFWNRTPTPSAYTRHHTNGILMTKAKIRENDPAMWSIWKPQICAEHVSTGNTFPLVFMDPYTLTASFVLLKCTNNTYQFALSVIQSNNAILMAFYSSTETL